MALTGDDYRDAGNVRTRRFKESKASIGYKQVGIFMSAESRELLHILKHQHGWTTQEAVEHIFKTYRNAMNDVVKDVVINNINNVDDNAINTIQKELLPADTISVIPAEPKFTETSPETPHEKPSSQFAFRENDRLLCSGFSPDSNIQFIPLREHPLLKKKRS